MRMNELMFFDAEKSSFRILLSSVHTSIVNKQTSLTVKSFNSRQFLLTVCRFFTSADVIIQLSSIFRFEIMMDTVVIFSRIFYPVTSSRTFSNDDEILTKSVILKSFNSLLRHLESFAVRRWFQMNEKHNIYEFLNTENQARIKNEKRRSNDHDGQQNSEDSGEENEKKSEKGRS